MPHGTCWNVLYVGELGPHPTSRRTPAGDTRTNPGVPQDAVDGRPDGVGARGIDPSPSCLWSETPVVPTLTVQGPNTGSQQAPSNCHAVKAAVVAPIRRVDGHHLMAAPVLASSSAKFAEHAFDAPSSDWTSSPTANGPPKR